MKTYVFTFDQTHAMSVMVQRALQSLLSLLWHLRGVTMLGNTQDEHELGKALLEDYDDANKTPYETFSFVVKSDRMQVWNMIHAFLTQHNGVGVHFIEIK